MNCPVIDDLLFFTSVNCDGEAANSVGKWFPQGSAPEVWAGETPLFMHKAFTLTSQVLIYAPPILLATLHSLWEKLNPAGEGQVNIWQTDSQFKEKLSG